MLTAKPLSLVLIAGVLGVVIFLDSHPLQAQQGAQPKNSSLTIVDFSGKEHKVPGWKFTSGTRRLHWLATEEEKKAAKSPSQAGPEVLEFSAGKPPIFKQRVLSLVPLKHVRAIEYDHKKATVTLKIAKTADTDLVLQGPTGYVDVNTLAIEAEEELNGSGKAHLKFLGGVSQGVKSIRFPNPVPLDPAPKGRPAAVTTIDKNNKTFTAVDLLPLYLQPDLTTRTEPSLSFQKTVRIELDKLQQLSRVGDGPVKGGLVFDVKLKSGTQKPLVLMELRPLAEKKSEQLLGLIGRVEAGYKLVPMSTIQQVAFDEAAAPPAEKK
jgi:hypothetical protein